jgi:hypothetical protein
MFIGCSEDDDETKPASSSNTNNQNQEDQMIFSVDGVERDYSENLVFVSGNNEVSIEGLEETTYPREELVVSFSDTASTGTYSINGSNSIDASFSIIDSTFFGTVYGEVYLAIDGSLNLTHNDVSNYKATGTFSFTAVNRDDNQDTVVVTEGKFNAAGN